MADLIAFQKRLSERLRAGGAGTAAWLGFRAGPGHWLVPLADVEAVLIPGRLGAGWLTPAPLARPWFMGVAALRGRLYGVTDFARLDGGGAAPAGSAGRLLLLHPRFGVNAALWVSEVSGLVNPHAPSDASAEPATSRASSAPGESRTTGESSAPGFAPGDGPRPADSPLKPWDGGEIRQGDHTWRRLRVAALTRSPQFLDAGEIAPAVEEYS